MKITVLGSSNEIGPNSYIHFLGAMDGFEITNVSLGASTSSAGLYSALKMEDGLGDFAIISYEINDLGAIADKIIDIDVVKDTLRTLIHTLRSKDCHPILAIVPSRQTINAMSLVEAAYLEVCEAEKINCFNAAALFRALKAEGLDYLEVMRDPYHMGPEVSRFVAGALATSLVALSAKGCSHVSMPTAINLVRLIPSSLYASSHRIETRGTSLRTAEYVRIALGETLTVPVGEDEFLQALVVNGGASGANVEFRSGSRIAVKRLSYRDPGRPAWNYTVVADIRGRMCGSEAGMDITPVARESEVTESTLHARPFFGEDYGVIEVEAFIVFSNRKVAAAVPVREYAGPVSIVSDETRERFLSEARTLF